MLQSCHDRFRHRGRDAPSAPGPARRRVVCYDEHLKGIGEYRLYSQWHIENLFRIFKTGRRVEALRLSTREQLELALALYLIIAWRIQSMTVLGRVTAEPPCNAVLDPAEWRAVHVAIHRRPSPVTPPPLPAMLGWIARLGGHLGRKGDGPPGPQAL